MAIILITGQPGGGKTALAVDMLAHDEQFKGRPLVVMGIPDLQIDHQETGPVSEWTEMRQSPEDPSIELPYFRFPENAVVVIDEAQRVYRPRAVGSKVPPEVAAFETHRHVGIDFVLLTQHPGLLDSNIRKLIGRHIHIRVTPLGRRRYEWTELGDPESASSREVAASSSYKLPKRAFALYKSSQLHTKIKVRIPWFVWMFGVAALSAIALGWYGFHRVSARTTPDKMSSSPQVSSSQSSVKDGAPQSNADYFAERIPRVAGWHHTAPRYDKLTEPTDAPWPVGCYVTAAWGNHKEKCRCIDQQGHDYATEDSICRSIVAHGVFKDWKSPADREASAGRQVAQPTGVPAAASPAPAPIPPPVPIQATAAI